MLLCVPSSLEPRDVPSNSPSILPRCNNGVRARLVLDYNPVCVVGWGVGCVRRVCIYVCMCMFVRVFVCVCVCVCVGGWVGGYGCGCGCMRSVGVVFGEVCLCVG